MSFSGCLNTIFVAIFFAATAGLSHSQAAPDDKAAAPNCCRPSAADKEGAPVRLQAQRILKLVTKQTPLAPPGMLGRNNMHGLVTVEICVDQNGALLEVRAVSGHPFAITSAMESVPHWSFKPYKSGGKVKCAIGTLTLKYDFSR